MFPSHKKQVEDLATLFTAGTLGHAYIFFGPAHIGKAAAARQLARFIETGAWLLEERSENTGPRPLTDTQMFLADDKGAIGIDAARAVKVFLSEKPFVSVRRTAIVDHAELLTPQAQNALLKTAAEPPESALLILVLPDPELMWPTLQSRFQKIYFPPPLREEMRKQLKVLEDPLAARFFETPPTSRKDFLKELTEPEDFNFAAF